MSSGGLGVGNLYILSASAPIRTPHGEKKEKKKKRWQLCRVGIASRFYDNSICSASKLHLVFLGLTTR